ncbi:MAG: beta-L-arabinofuranosidase domain-containing protein [Planctomycetota bacterium]
MALSLDGIKARLLDAYVAVRSRDGRRIHADDLRGRARCTPRADAEHVAAAVGWIKVAQDVGHDDGVAAMYSFVSGWVASYPETTGYIVPTLLDAAARTGDADCRARALRMADWLLTQQLADGAFPGLFVGSGSHPRVFNTGQVIFGLVRAAAESGETRYLEAARRAGDWLVALQEEDGCWRRHTYSGIPHTYNVRAAWSLARLAEATGQDRYRSAAAANADWALTQQTKGGWFENNSFRATDPTTPLHTIAYAARGLLEIGAATGATKYVDASLAAAQVLLQVWEQRGLVPGAFGPEWSAPVAWRCLPGEAQLALVWLRLFALVDEPGLRAAAEGLVESLKAAHFVAHANPAIAGGLSGSLPIHGLYERYCLVNWGPKFLVDALLLKGARTGGS